MKRFFCMTFALLMLLTACGQESPQETTAPIQPEVVTIQREETVEGKTLAIHAQVALPDLNTLEAVTLVFDQEKFQTMAEDLVLPQYPDAQAQEDDVSGSRGWNVETEGRLLISLDCFDQGFQAGWVSFLDVARDRNGTGMGEDDENAFTYGYTTPHIPTGLECTGQEAGRAMADFLGGYSCFSYVPWSLRAQDAPGGGYYQAFLEPQFDGQPVKGQGPLLVSACLSEEGVFTFQGILALKEARRERMEATMTLDQAVEAFREEVPYLSGTAVDVSAIRWGYLARSGYDGEWTLCPAWLFTCTETEGSHTNCITLAFPMDGSTCQKLTN